jgi:propanol-preferring alcohol dehydrogenase
MKAMLLKRIHRPGEGENPLEGVDLPEPDPSEGEILVKVSTCGVCHTELDEIEGRTPPSAFPMVLGHQVVGTVEKTGSKAGRFKRGDRVGIAWIHSACGRCQFCRDGRENLCEKFEATGRDAPGGYAQYTTVSEEFAYEIPGVFSDSQAAPLLCAGAVGYRSLRLTGLRNGQNLGFFGFGASAHLVIQAAKHKFPDSKFFVFVRSEKERTFARELGAVWAGGIDDEAPEELHCAIDTTPVWFPVVEAMKRLERGGRLIVNAIRKEDADKASLLNLDYETHLWMEKQIVSVANVTRRDVTEFLQLAAEIPITPNVEEFRLEEANRALMELKKGKIRGAKVLKMG